MEGEGSAGASESAGTGGGNGNAAGGDEGEQQQRERKPVPKMRQTKVNGQIEYVNEDEVFSNYQKYKAADMRLKEVSRKEQEIADFYERLEKDPGAVFRDPKLSKHKRALAESWMEEEFQAAAKTLDPKDQELEDLRAKLKEREERDEEDKKKKDEDQQREFVEKRKTAISQTLHEAMQATSLSKHPESAAATLREMAVYMRAAKERGEDVTPQQLVEHIHSSRFNQMYTLAHQFEGDQLIEFLGPEIIKRIRKADIERIKKQRDRPAESHRNDSYQSGQRRQPQKYIDPTEERLAFRSQR